MTFHERFKGRTSLIDKEGITGVVKSQASPILKANSPNIDRKKKANSLEIIPEKEMISHNIKRKMFKMHDGIIDNSNSKKVSGFNLRVDVENPLKNNYSIDSPLLERMKEEQDIKSISSFKKVNSQSRTQFELKSPSKNDYYGPNLYTSNILDNLNNNNKSPFNSFFAKAYITDRPKISSLMQSTPSYVLNRNMEYSAKNFMSPTYNNKLNKLTSPNKINNYLKNDSYIDNPEYNLILPSINQKSNLSNSGRNIVLTNLNCNFSDEEHKFSKIKNNSALNYGNFNIFSDNSNLTVPSQEKEKLDYELSKLEEQYKDIINKFSILSKKRDLMN